MDRLANLLGVAALAAADRMRADIEAGLSSGGSAPAALVHLQAYPDASVAALGRVLGVAQPVAVRLVDRLEADGLVRRAPGPDRRSLALRLTDAGQRAADELLARRTHALRELLGELTADEQAQLTGALEPLVAALAHDRPSALHTCRLCDRAACTSDPGCPLDHTVE